MVARGERPPPDQKGHNLYQLFAKLVAAQDDEELLRLANEATNGEQD